MKISEDLSNVIKKARQVGDSHPKNPSLVWTEYKPGKFDWRNRKGAAKSNAGNDSDTVSKYQKLLNTLKKTDSDKLRVFANKPGNAPKLRQAAYDELVERGEDVSDINLNTGRYGKLKSAMDVSADDTDDLKDLAEEESEDDDEFIDYKNPEFIKSKFGFTDWSKATKAQRIAYDSFVHKVKTTDPDYVNPIKEIGNLNKMYIRWMQTDSPLFIASGGAGVGKTHNFHLCAEAMNKKPFDASVDEPGDPDYDYVEAPEATSLVQLAQILKEHNGKIILFDDADGLLKPGSDALGMLKKATATSGKRIVGKKSTNKNANVDPFEFTGKIIFLTNMSQADFTRNEDMNAIYSRANKKDMYFTKREQLFFIDQLKHKFNFTGVDRLPNTADDIQEREDVFQLLKDNIDKIDPAKFNSRTMKELIDLKRAEEGATGLVKNDPVMAKLLHIEDDDWRDSARIFLTKGVVSAKSLNIEKAKQILNLK